MIWAALRERPSEAMQKYVKTLQGRRWYNRAWDAIKTAWRGILSRMGFNRADLSGIDKMTPDEFNEFLDKAMIGGKTLGRLETQGVEGAVGNRLRSQKIKGLDTDDIIGGDTTTRKENDNELQPQRNRLSRQGNRDEMGRGMPQEQRGDSLVSRALKVGRDILGGRVSRPQGSPEGLTPLVE